MKISKTVLMIITLGSVILSGWSIVYPAFDKAYMGTNPSEIDRTNQTNFGDITVKVAGQESEIEVKEGAPRVLFIMDKNYGGNCPYILSNFEEYGWNITTTALYQEIDGCSYLHDRPFTVDCLFWEIDPLEAYDCIVLLPGSSHTSLLDNATVHKFIRSALGANKVVAAWCNAVRILARADALQGRNITGADDYKEEYLAAGATFNTQVPPVRDGNLITSVRSRFYRTEMCELIRNTVEDYTPDTTGFSTYLGGEGDEKGLSSNLRYLGDSVLDHEGNLITVGRSAAEDFPTKNALNETKNGGIDITISKFSPTGALLFSTYYGGEADEWATGVAVDSNNNIVVTGVTKSNHFPTVNALQSSNLGGTEAQNDAFLMKMDSEGQTVLFSTYFGGTGSDWAYALAMDQDDRIAITGTTDSGDLPMVNAVQEEIVGSRDIFLTIFASDGTNVNFSTFLGGSGNDAGRGIEFDSNHNVAITGLITNAASLQTYLPNDENPIQTGYAGGTTDSFIAKYSNNGDLELFTFVGGSMGDIANDLTIDSNDNIIITGSTSSDDFPLVKPVQKTRIGRDDCFIYQLHADGSATDFGTYLGGEMTDVGTALRTIRVEEADIVVVTGYTASNDFQATDTTMPEAEDTNENVFITILTPIEKTPKLQYSLLYGGSAEDVSVSLCADQYGFIYLTGFTYSEDFPTVRSYQESYGGSCDLFVMKISVTGELTTSRGIPGFMPFSLGGAVLVGMFVIIRRKSH